MRLVTAALAPLLVIAVSETAVFAQIPQSPQPSVSTSVPRLINVSGVFRPADGQPPAPTEVVTLGIYADETGGAPLWEESQTIAVDRSGRYMLLLGATQADGVPLDLFASGEARWLGMSWGRTGEVEGRRTRLTSVPYALRASDADTLGGKPASSYLLAPTGGGGTATTAVTSPSGAVTTNLVNPGTANMLAKYVNSSDVGDSAVYEAGGLVGINTTAPLDVLHSRFYNTTGNLTGIAVQNTANTATSYSGMLFYDQNGALGQFQGFNNSTHEYRINNIAANGTINFMIGSSSKFKVANNGYIGIGTANPTVPVDIAGSAFVSTTGASAYFTTGNTALTLGSNVGWFTSLRTSSGIIAGDGVLSTSDARAKNIRGRSDAAADLNKLLGIEVTDFVFKDIVEKGDRPHKKVIAQQVEKVYPESVRHTTDVVPDIYRKAPIKDGWIELATDLKAGDRVRLITENGHRDIHEVLEVRKGGFRTDFVENVGQVFVYGREVKDFRVVDYEAIAMLNVSATQELNRLIMQQDGEIQALNARLAALERMLRDQPEKQPRPKEQ